jgi:chemotaxis signal transduction protein
MIPATANVPAHENRHWLLVQAAGAWLGLPASDVVEVRPASRWLPLPAVPEYVCGLINWRGSPLPVLELASALGLGSPASGGEGDDGTEEQRVAVVRSGPFAVGVLSDRMYGVVEAGPDAIGAVNALTHGRLRDFSVGELESPRGVVALLDLARLLEATRIGGEA